MFIRKNVITMLAIGAFCFMNGIAFGAAKKEDKAPVLLELQVRIQKLALPATKSHAKKAKEDVQVQFGAYLDGVQAILDDAVKLSEVELPLFQKLSILGLRMNIESKMAEYVVAIKDDEKQSNTKAMWLQFKTKVAGLKSDLFATHKAAIEKAIDVQLAELIEAPQEEENKEIKTLETGVGKNITALVAVKDEHKKFELVHIQTMAQLQEQLGQRMAVYQVMLESATTQTDQAQKMKAAMLVAKQKAMQAKEKNLQGKNQTVQLQIDLLGQQMAKALDS